MDDWNNFVKGNRKFFLAFAVYCMVIVVIASLNIKTQREAIITLAAERLESITRYKAREISYWVNERKKDAKVLVASHHFPGELNQLLNAPDNNAYREMVLHHFMPMTQYYGFDDILLVDSSGQVFASVLMEESKLGENSRRLVASAFRSGLNGFSDFYFCEHHNRIRIDFYSPVFPTPADTIQPRAMVILRIDPGAYLYPLIQSWPVPSKTSESLLVGNRNDSVIFLNELRHVDGTALKMTLPLSLNRLPAALAILGIDGVVRGTDYRGKDVLAWNQRIEGTPWHLVSKTDMDEVLEPMQGWYVRTGLAAFGLIIIGLLIVYLFILQRRKDFLHNLYEIETQRMALAKHYELFLKYANDIILLLDPEGRIEECNEKALAEYGYSREELIGQPVVMLNTEETRDGHAQRIDKIRTEKSALFETWHQRKDGERLPVEISARLIEVEGKQFIQGIIRNITERKEQEALIIRERNLAQKYLDTTGSLIVAISVDEKVSLINRRGAELLGYDQNQIPGMNWFDHFVPAGNREMIRSVFHKLINREADFPEFYENPVVSASGEEHILLWHNVLMLDDEGKVEGTLSSGEVVTALRSKEKELEKLNAQLEERVRERTAQLEAANRELESFSYSVSHDLRSPLRSLDGFSLALLEDYEKILDGKASGYLHRIRNASQKMGVLIDDLLRLSRISRMEISKEMSDLSTMAGEICRELSETYKGKSYTIRIRDGLTACADPGLMKIALRNIFDNAFKFSSLIDEPVIIFDTVIRDNRKEFMIQDNGAGFDMRYASKIFGAFQRLHTPEEFTGTGIGLTIVQRIINRHEGTLTAESEPGKGATFYFWLPEL